MSFKCTVCVLGHLLEDQAVHCGWRWAVLFWLSTQRQHTVSSSMASEECDHPALSAGQTSLSSRGQWAQILFITHPPTLPGATLRAQCGAEGGAAGASGSVLHASVSWTDLCLLSSRLDQEKMGLYRPSWVVRASNIFPILSAILLLMGGVCIAASRFYKSKRNIILGAGILFVAAGLSNIIGVIVYISAALGDISPKKDEDKKWQYSYGWSFYFGGLSFIMAEMVGVLAVNIYIEKNKELRCRSRTDIFKTTTHAMLRLPSYRFRRRSRSSSRSTDPSRSRDPSPVGVGGGKNFGLPPSALLSQGPISVSTLPNPHSRSHTALAGGDISLYTLSRDPKLAGLPPMYGTVDRATLYQLHNCFPKDGGGGGGVMMSGTLPLLKSHNPSNTSNSNAPMANSVAPPPFTSSTVDRERGMGTLDRLKGDRESNSNTLNRKTTPV
ncbi:hypothetical protein XENOCAPTIV_006314 [Xenoophorus captivus]|uniref:Uncharacterized protein n=1 Tax=Xenoophorus captivus TaxID=1517983 RepID=A0ABV0RSI4_9TELE